MATHDNSKLIKIMEGMKECKEIENAKKMLEEAGYLIIKPSKMQLEDCRECNEMYKNNEEKECVGCSCSVCLFN